MAKVLLGVSGGIAAYKACALTSRLVQRGDQVDVILTEEACRFVTPLSFSALTRRIVWTSLWQNPEEIPHIALVRTAQVMIIVPATANTLARLALGMADDLLTNAALAARIPLIVAPAMNSAMYEHPATQEHLATLRKRGVTIIEPEVGFLAERESGVGRLASEEKLLAAIDHALAPTRSLAGKRILITAGPTREAIDPVRFISNPATGASGIALAAEAHRRGAEVRLILGPTHVPLPIGIEVCRVTSAAQMLEAATGGGWKTPDLIIATAAVADERPAKQAEQKLKKRDGGLQAIEFTPTEDIVARLRERFPQAYIVGFAAETEAHIANAQDKLTKKRLDAIVVNDVAQGRGFGVGDNVWTILTPTARHDVPQGSKNELAAAFFELLPTIAAQFHQATESKPTS
jgi:phosphopantothenoylcysteine decarboxylase/phosphopantothenate--cysteine ligase